MARFDEPQANPVPTLAHWGHQRFGARRSRRASRSSWRELESRIPRGWGWWRGSHRVQASVLTAIRSTLAGSHSLTNRGPSGIISAIPLTSGRCRIVAGCNSAGSHTLAGEAVERHSYTRHPESGGGAATEGRSWPVVGRRYRMVSCPNDGRRPGGSWRANACRRERCRHAKGVFS